MKNTTLAMVTVLAAVTMLSAVLAVPMQQAIASSDGGDEDSIDAEIKNKNKCGGNENLAVTTCLNDNVITNAPILGLD